MVLQEGQGTKRAHGKDEIVNRYADAIAEQHARPLVFLGNARHEPMVHLSVDQLADQFSQNGGDDDAPQWPQNGAKLCALAPRPGRWARWRPRPNRLP